MELIISRRNPHVVMTVKCAVCDTHRGDTNHWWVLSVAGDTLVIEPMGDKLWGLHDGEFPVCGNAHAQKKVEQFLQTGKL